MNIKQEIRQLGDSLQEIMASATAVKGEAFAQAVGVQFEATQLVEIIGRLGIMAGDEHEEYVNTLVATATEILGSITVKACPDIDTDQFDEAMELAHTLYERRNRVVAAIKKGLDDGESGEQ